jgi:transposase-like protein
MRVQCPSNSIRCAEFGSIVGYGKYYRKSDRKIVQRYKCTHCLKHFSSSTFTPEIHQNKRHLNEEIKKKLISGVSQRRIARLLGIHMITVARKLKFLAEQLRIENYNQRLKHAEIVELQFDDLETFEHSKMKPLSVTLAVEKHTRYVAGFEVSRMPAKGLLAKRAIKKYGYRKDERKEARERLFRRITRIVSRSCLIESDENPHYPESVKAYFPDSLYETFKGKRGCVTGQGELKAVAWDPLFSLNHTCAMLRANINRLFRKTWCTTKKLQPLIDHIELYVWYHNTVLIKEPSTK